MAAVPIVARMLAVRAAEQYATKRCFDAMGERCKPRKAPKALPAGAPPTLDLLVEKEDELLDTLNEVLRLHRKQLANVALSRLLKNLHFQSLLLHDEYQALANVINIWYAKARGDLITNIGQYCSYCEMPVAASLAVEHMVPKKSFPSQSVLWTNFLLACTICNSTKGDKPSFRSGTILATTLTVPNPTYNQIETAARNSYLWPTDPNYTRFTQAFQYQLQEVLTDRNGMDFGSVPIATTELFVLVNKGPGQFKLAGDGVTIQAEIWEDLPLIEGDLAKGVATYLNTLTVATPTVRTPVTIDPSLPEDRQPALSKYFSSNGLENSWRVSFRNPRHTVQILRTATSAAEVTVTTPVTLLLTGEGGPRVRDQTGGVIPIGGIHAGNFYPYLLAGVLPPGVESLLGLDAFNGGAVIKQPNLDDKSTWSIRVTRTYRMIAAGPQMHVVAKREVPVRLMLQSAGEMAVKAESDIHGMKLNANPFTDVRESDRRMAHRTRTFFAAVEAIRNIRDSSVLDAKTYPNAFVDVQAMAVQTAKATGFWTVWRWVADNMLVAGPSADTIRTNLVRGLMNVDNFPGTRPPPER